MLGVTGSDTDLECAHKCIEKSREEYQNTTVVEAIGCLAEVVEYARDYDSHDNIADDAG